MENEQRIWNKSELEQMDEWVEDKVGDWLNTEKNIWITKSFLGKPIEALKEMNYPVFDEMIAKTDTPISPEIQKSIDEAHKRLNKGEGITLRNGTVLKVGKKYRLDDWDNLAYAIILAFGQEKMIIKFFFNSLDDEELETIELDWKPYTEPKEEPKPKTLEGYQEYFVLTNKGSLTRGLLNDEQLKEMQEMLHGDIRKIYTRQEAIEAGLKI